MASFAQIEDFKIGRIAQCYQHLIVLWHVLHWKPQQYFIKLTAQIVMNVYPISSAIDVYKHKMHYDTFLKTGVAMAMHSVCHLHVAVVQLLLQSRQSFGHIFGNVPQLGGLDVHLLEKYHRSKWRTESSLFMKSIHFWFFTPLLDCWTAKSKQTSNSSYLLGTWIWAYCGTAIHKYFS